MRLRTRTTGQLSTVGIPGLSRLRLPMPRPPVSHAPWFLTPRPLASPAPVPDVHSPQALQPHVHAPQALRPRNHAPTPCVPTPTPPMLFNLTSTPPTPTPQCSATSRLAIYALCFHVHAPHALSPQVHAARVSSSPLLSCQSLGFAEAFWKLVVPARRLAVSNPCPCFTSLCFASNKTSLVTNLAMNLEAGGEGGVTGGPRPEDLLLPGTGRPSLSLGSLCSRAASQAHTRHPDLLCSVSFCGRKVVLGFG